jgi:hypothetical protein
MRWQRHGNPSLPAVSAGKRGCSSRIRLVVRDRIELSTFRFSDQVVAYVYRKDRINPVSASTKTIPSSTRGTTTAATTMAAKASIIPLSLLRPSALEPARTAGAVPAGRAGREMASTAAWRSVSVTSLTVRGGVGSCHQALLPSGPMSSRRAPAWAPGGPPSWDTGWLERPPSYWVAGTG